MNRHLSLFVPLTVFVFIVVNLSSHFAEATPWLSNRYAQNCAGCHAPGRLNLPAKDRRCTLSCQGCHVNPNGGGLRNQYGIWNQQRWLRSFSTKGLMRGEKPTPAPDFHQKYVNGGKKKKKGKGAEKDGKKKKKKKKKKKDKKRKKKKKKKKKSKKVVIFNDDYDEAIKKEPPTMMATRRLDHNEVEYDYATYTDWRVDAESWSHFLSRVPKGDPWRLERSEMFTVSGDVRYIYGTLDGEIQGTPISDKAKNLSSIMAVDLGLRYRPVGDILSFVVEPRFSNGPYNKDLEDGFTSSSHVRSAYAIADMLPWNSWGMFGLYKPMFGFHQADHNTLAQEVTGMGQNATFKALGIGGSPNLPFFNAHMIMPTTSNELNSSAATSGKPTSNDEGININAGARFVTKSLSAKLSYWKTDNKDKKRNRTMISVSGAGMFGPVIVTYEHLRTQDEWEAGTLGADAVKNAGDVDTIDLKFRVWREIYLMLNTAVSNTATDLSEGSATETMMGVKSFLTPGLELELLTIARKEEKESGGETTTSYEYNLTQLQLHYFF